MLRSSISATLFACATSLVAFAAQGQDFSDQSLGLSPAAPRVGALPGGTTPSYGQPPKDEGDWRFDFHGFLTAPVSAGINERANREPGESKMVVHAPPVVPDDRETFSHTGVVPLPYIQLNFSYGNSIVTGTVSVLALQTNVSTGFFDPPSQAGINDVYLTIHPDLSSSKARLEMIVGAFTSRYGNMGEYDEGRYGTPLIARVNGAGEHLIGTFDFGDIDLILEQGLVGSTNKAGSGMTPDGWNDFADPNAGTTFVGHLHAGLSYKNMVLLGGHYLSAFSSDERATGTLGRTGKIDVAAADLRLSLGRFGHLYTAVSRTEARDARTVGRQIQVLNTRGGAGLMEHYLGENSGGNGKLLTVGAQYDLSVGRLVSYPVPFSGDGPDVFVSLFGMQAQVTSDDPAQNGTTKQKFGMEATYSLLSWLATAVRYDRVAPDVDNERASFAVLSPRVIFRSDWQSTDQVVLQYSRWLPGSMTAVRTGYPPVEDLSVAPDEHMVSLSASMWW